MRWFIQGQGWREKPGDESEPGTGCAGSLVFSVLPLLLVADLVTFPSLPPPAVPTRGIQALPQSGFCPLISLLVCLSLPQHGEAEEEAAKGGAAQQLHGLCLAFA